MKVAALVTIDACHDSPAMMRKEDQGWRGLGDHVDYVRVAIQLDRMRILWRHSDRADRR